jgi:hypothetical protein
MLRFFNNGQCTKKLGFKNTFNEEYELYRKKGSKLKIMMKNRKRNRSIKKIVLTGNVPQNVKWQTERPWLVFSEEKNVMTCTTCIMDSVPKN